MYSGCCGRLNAIKSLGPSPWNLGMISFLRTLNMISRDFIRGRFDHRKNVIKDKAVGMVHVEDGRRGLPTKDSVDF